MRGRYAFSLLLPYSFVTPPDNTNLLQIDYKLIQFIIYFLVKSLRKSNHLIKYYLYKILSERYRYLNLIKL